MESQSSAVVLQPRVETRRPISLLIDARKIDDGGIGVYTQNLIEGALESGLFKVGVIGDSESLSNRRWANQVHIQHESARPYSLEELLLLGGRVDFSAYDLFHTPHFVLPYRIPIPSFVTIHDTIHIQHPEKPWYPQVASFLMRSAIKRATRVLAVSNSTYQDLCGLLGDKQSLKNKIRVVPNSINPHFVQSEISREFVRARFGIRGKYLLAVYSMLKPHKGLRELLHVYKRLRKEHPQLCCDTKLVLAGKGIDALVNTGRFIEEVGAIPGVHVIGSVLREELIQLYGSAEALVVSSLAEGFCLPVLEAQALGTPVISRPVPAITELMTANDLQAEDFSEQALYAVIESFLREMPLRERPDRKELNRHLLRFNRADLTSLLYSVYLETLA